MQLEPLTPLACDQEIFKHGKVVCVVVGSSVDVERWVKLVAMRADARVDWRFSGGKALVLHLGDDESRTRVVGAIRELEEALPGYVLAVR